MESTPLTRFTLFPSLPTELRLKIYSHIHALLCSTFGNRILKISYSPSLSRYISNTAPPLLLSISPESRFYALSMYQYTFLSLGPSNPYKKTTNPKAPLPIPIRHQNDILYISELFPLLSTHLHDFLYNLSTSASRHLIRRLAVDLRVWNQLCENGFLGILGRMRGLREVDMVVEFGRCFEGDLGFLEAPEWRADLWWIAERAGRELSEERGRYRMGRSSKGEIEGLEEVVVKSVILTRGGEHA